MADHYYSANPTSVSDVQELSYEAGGKSYRFFSDHSVFSIQRIDPGTDLLIRTVLEEEEQTDKILDLGCGYGPIGVVLGDQLHAEKVTMIDVNERAMDLARRAAALASVPASVIKEEELTDTDHTLAATNPPIRAGKKTVYHLFAVAYDHLAKGGVLYVVIQKKQGADSAVKELNTLFGNCETVGRKAGYHILRSVK